VPHTPVGMSDFLTLALRALPMAQQADLLLWL